MNEPGIYGGFFALEPHFWAQKQPFKELNLARANRHYIPGYVWHITHRCHKREFLLKFARDQRRWLQWLFEAKKRLGTSILNYAVTSNHIHLVIRDDKGEEVIPQTMQLIAGRTGQEYNQRKGRKKLVLHRALPE